jgi:hypothetical protein
VQGIMSRASWLLPYLFFRKALVGGKILTCTPVSEFGNRHTRDEGGEVCVIPGLCLLHFGVCSLHPSPVSISLA